MATPEQRETYLRQLLQMARDEGATADIIDVAFDYGRSVTPKITKTELRAALLREISARAPSRSPAAEQAGPAAGPAPGAPGICDIHPDDRAEYAAAFSLAKEIARAFTRAGWRAAPGTRHGVELHPDDAIRLLGALTAGTAQAPGPQPPGPGR